MTDIIVEKFLGKIKKAKFGFGGYDGAMVGLTIQVEWDEGRSGTRFFEGTWSTNPNEGGGWTLKNQNEKFAEVVRITASILHKAKKSHVEELIGVPVEVTAKGLDIKGWRVLEEVL